MESTDPGGGRAALRRRELDGRIIEIHQRNDQLSAALVQDRLSRDGSTQAQVTRAGQLAQLARERAAEATRRAGVSYLNAASAHDRAARMHELLAETDGGNEQEHRTRAAEHRRLAVADRASAGPLTGTPG